MPIRKASDFSSAVAAVIVSKYKKKRMTQEGLAAATGISYTTLRRMMAGESEIEVADLGKLCAAIGIDPGAVLAEALEDIGGIEKLAPVSEDSSTKDDLETRRLQKEAEQMSVAEIERNAIAATEDAERRTDEPDPA